LYEVVGYHLELGKIRDGGEVALPFLSDTVHEHAVGALIATKIDSPRRCRSKSAPTGQNMKSKETALTEPKILVVEDEDLLGEMVRESFESRGVEHISRFVDSVSEALRLVEKAPFDLVVCNHGGPGRIDGLDFLRRAGKLETPIQVVLGADGHLEEDMIDALKLGCTNFFLKSYSKERISELLFSTLQRQQGFRGRVVGMRLEDVIQIFCYRKESTLVWVFDNSHTGAIYVNDGAIVHAQCGELTGVEAFYEIVGWKYGEFLSQVALQVPPRTVFMDWQSLLMEGMRQKDEIRHALGPVPFEPDPNVVPMAEEPAVSAEAVKRIMIVDDSRFIRKIVQEILESDTHLTVAGYATNGQEALERIDELKPDLILLDWDMPVMKGSTALMHIMIRSPCPVVILSGFVGGVGANPFDLLCLGAVDFLRKPHNNWRRDGRADDLVKRVKDACSIKFDRIRRVRIPSLLGEIPKKQETGASAKFLTVFGSSTGGASDLIRIIPSLPEDLPSTLVVLHDMQVQAVGAFVDYLDRRSRMKIRPVESGMPIEQGVCYVHPAVEPLELVREGDVPALKLLSDRPGSSVLDHFLVSSSKIMGRNMVAVLLSGAPDRGVDGLKATKQAEGLTVVQDPASSIDPRMAERALKEGIVDYKLPADTLAETFEKLIS
jgi:two-component system, chemotaxis family, protein-glutamate methylesterase/glutaminase